MLIRKNKSNNYNSDFLDLAFEQAKINLGSTNENPSVGCVVEKEGAVISAGRTSVKGRPHAEKNALNKKLDFKNSNLYVTMEPCAHYGRTPPCTNIIIKKKIKNVFFSTNDLDSRTSLLGQKKLRKEKINVKLINKKNNGKNFYQSYFSYIKKTLPILEGKIALSKDYYTINKKNKWITNSYSRRRVHLLRSQYNALITTSKTVNKDNSMLNCRIEGMERKSPHLIVIDRYLKIKKRVQLFNIKNRKIYIVTSSNNKSKMDFLIKKGVKILRFDKLNTAKDYKKLFIYFNKVGFSRIFVESGLKFMNFLIINKLINSIYVFKSYKNLRKDGKNNSSKKFIKRFKLKNKIKVNLFKDILYKERII